MCFRLMQYSIHISGAAYFYAFKSPPVYLALNFTLEAWLIAMLWRLRRKHTGDGQEVRQAGNL